MDWTPLLHAAVAVAAQTLAGLLLGNWWLGGLMACVWWAAREHTQAEYRWIAAYGQGKRENMLWWGGFDPRAWDRASLLDLAAPIAACAGLFLLLNETVPQ